MKKLIMLFILFTMTFANDLVIQGTGYGATENQATSFAKRDALEKGIGQTLVSQTEVENFMLKKDIVLTKTSGHIKNYRIKSKVQESDGVWKIVIQATLSKDGLNKDLVALGILVQTIGNPRIALLITESVSASKEGVNYVEMEFLNGFQKKGFEVVDPNQTLKYKESKEAMAALGGDPKAAAKLGSLINADVLIVGVSKSQEADLSGNAYFKGTGMKSVGTTLSLKAFDVGTRKILAAGNAQASMVDPNIMKAAQKGSQKVVKKMMGKKDQFFDRLVSSWKHKANDGATYKVVVKNVTSFKLVKELKATLLNITENVIQRSFKKPVLGLDVKFMGTLDDFCTRIDGMKAGDKEMSVEEFQGSKVVLQLK